MVTLLGFLTYPPKKGILQMIFLFPRWDMLIPWRVLLRVHVKLGESILHETPEDMADAETPDAPADGPTLPTEAVEATDGNGHVATYTLED